MYPTVEVRWFYEGSVSPRAVEWFQQHEGRAEGQPGRVDYYLRLTEGDALGIKLRQSRIEIKQRHRQHGVVRFHERVAGRVEHWRKWSFELAEASIVVSASLWTPVQKERWLRIYRPPGEGGITAVSAEGRPRQGVGLELTKIGVGGKAWWSLGTVLDGQYRALRPLGVNPPCGKTSYS